MSTPADESLWRRIRGLPRPVWAGLGLAFVLSACAWERGGRFLSTTPIPPSPSFSSSPPPAGGLRFAVIGDFGSSAPAQLQVADAMCALNAARPFRLVLTVGDNVYPDGRPSRFDAVFAPYACLLDAGVGFHASLGNHDVLTDGGQPEIDDPRFGMSGANYVLREDGVRFVVADSNDLDRAWLESALVAEAGDRWTIAVFHHPVLSPGSEHGSTVGFGDLPAMFERHRVDLVLNGHDHVYAASRPVEGVRYVVTGGGGGALYGCEPASFAERCEPRHHFLEVVAGPGSIEVRAFDATGAEFHRFSTAGLP